MPGDPEWPTVEEWNAFNTTVSGRLIPTSQRASACHDPHYDAAACAYVQENWHQPWFHDDSSSSIMAAAVEGEKCSPFTPREQPCLAGNAVAYTVNVTGVDDIVKTMRFAQEKNIRFVLRNTGHDYMGKSTGAGALSVWTHHLKSTERLDYRSSYYNGPAIRVGAGIQVGEAYVAARAHDSLIVGGDCDTVGVAGGYLQGGGHSAMSSKYGLGVDNVLEWQVLINDGQVVTASPNENSDLYWALSGGGAGTYGIVLSVVVKLYADMPITGATLNFERNATNSNAFRQAVQASYQQVPTLTANGAQGIAEGTSDMFLLSPMTFPNMTEQEARALMQPMIQALDQARMAYDYETFVAPTWLDYWTAHIKPNPTQLVQNAQCGGWMLPSSVLEQSPEAFSSAVQTVTDAGCVLVDIAANVSLAENDATRNSVLPAWRDAAVNVILSTPWPDGANLTAMSQRAKMMTHTCVAVLNELAPGMGAYMNEADPNQPCWQAFYGLNYDRLLQIKRKYNPLGMLWAHTAVGSETWAIDDNGRLCPA